MNPRVTLIALVALVLGVGGYLYYQDNQYRQIHGTVTEVSLVTWGREVEDAKDKRPVLVYFYRQNEQHPANEAQNKEVRDFAWRTAGKVKVVAVNVAHIENLPLAIAHGVLRQPGFVVITGEDFSTGPSGVFTTEQDLQRLLLGAQMMQANPNRPR